MILIEAIKSITLAKYQFLRKSLLRISLYYLIDWLALYKSGMSAITLKNSTAQLFSQKLIKRTDYVTKEDIFR